MSDQGPGPGGSALEQLAALQNTPGFASSPFGGPAAPPGYPSFDGGGLPPIAPPQGPPGGFGPPPPAPPTAPKTLEDLYSFYPDIGDGAYRLRVERIWPKAMAGQVVAGILGDLDEKISLEEFRQRFGGNRYKVSVIGPDPRTRNNPHAASVVRTLMTVQFDIPGPPRMDGYGPQTNDEDAMQRGPMNMGMGWGGVAPQVEVARITAEQDWRRQSEQERASLTRMAIEAERSRSEMPAHVLQSLQEQQRLAIEKVEQGARDAIASKDVQVQDLMDRARRAENEVSQMRETLLREQMMAAQQRKGLESEERERIISDYREQLNRQQTEFRLQMERAEERARNELQLMAQRLTDTQERLARDFNTEKERIINDARYREDRMKQDSDRDRQQLRETYDARLQDIQRSFERDVTMLREQQAREIAAIRSQWETTANLSEKTAQMKIENNDGEMRRKEDEIRRLREELSDTKKQLSSKDREMEQMRRDAIKAPLEAIKESKDLLEAIGMEVVPAGSGGGGGEDEEAGEDGEGKEKGAGWQTVLQEGLKMAIGAAPDLIKAAVGGQGAPGQDAAAQAQAQAQQMALAQQQAAIVQAQQAAAMQRAAAPQGPIAPAPPPARRPPPAPAAPQAQGPAPASAARPQAAGGRAPRGANQPTQQAAQPQQQPVSDETRAVIEGGAIDQLVEKLDQAITFNFPADTFAAEFIKTVGPKVAGEITQTIKAETLLGLISQAVKQGAPAGKACITNDGKKYVRAVFNAVGQQLAGAPLSVATPAAPQPTAPATVTASSPESAPVEAAVAAPEPAAAPSEEAKP